MRYLRQNLPAESIHYSADKDFNNMQLILNKPLVLFDLETTEISLTRDRIIEIYLIRLMPDGREMHHHEFFNPGMPIPPEATAIHGITDDDVKDKPFFSDKANELKQFIDSADLAGFNSNKFDVPILVEEFLRAGIDFEFEKRNLIDVMRIFHVMEPRNLAAALRFYCNREIENAHSAKYDTIATLDVLKAQMERYPDLDHSAEGLHKLSAQSDMVDLAGRIVYNENREEVFNFGKHKGKKVREVFKKEPSYYDWMIQSDFSAQTKKILTRIRLSMID